jgi:fructosamine-3-kinase
MAIKRGIDKQKLSSLLGSEVRELAPLSGSYGIKVLQGHLADGRHIVVKAGTPPLPDHLVTESWMLAELARISELPVPKVYHSEATLLVMEFITGNESIRPVHERHMAELLAALHGKARPFFGLERDTTIGALPQSNRRHERWVDFYREERLLFMARLAFERGGLDSAMLARLRALAARLERYLDEPAHPALVHGDIWAGNVICAGGRVAGLIHPAISLSHPEIELAFMTMFGSFGPAFFDAYGALADFDASGFLELRRDIYLLYPQLVHVLLCGASYLHGIDRTLRRLGF